MVQTILKATYSLILMERACVEHYIFIMTHNLWVLKPVLQQRLICDENVNKNALFRLLRWYMCTFVTFCYYAETESPLKKFIFFKNRKNTIKHDIMVNVKSYFCTAKHHFYTSIVLWAFKLRQQYLLYPNLI